MFSSDIQYASVRCWRPLLEAGIDRALIGDTTLSEVRRVLYQVD